VGKRQKRFISTQKKTRPLLFYESAQIKDVPNAFSDSCYCSESETQVFNLKFRGRISYA